MVRGVAAIGLDVQTDKDDLEFELKDPNQGFVFGPLSGLGVEARIGGNETGVGIQLRIGTRRVIVGMGEAGTSVEMLKPRAIAVARVFLSTMK